MHLKRVIVWSWSKDLTIRPVHRLIDAGEIEVVLWFDREGEKDFRTKDFSYVPEMLLEQLATQELDSASSYAPDDAELPEQMIRFLDVYSRVNFSKGHDYFDHQNLFHLYYQYFSHVILQKQVDTVLFFEPPHSGADYMLYLAAKTRGVRTIINMQSLIPNRFFCVTDLDDFGVFDTSPDVGEAVQLKIERRFEKDLFYMKKAKHKRGWMISRLLRDLLLSSFTHYHPIPFAGIIQKQVGRIRYTREYKRNAVTSVDLDKKFVYFPMHLQPELTTATLGGEFSDQLLALEKLSKLLPDDWFIYAKENPKQGFQQRNRLFFERLRRIPNCVYVDTAVNTYELTRNCQFVASITGTACWESVSGGLPCLVFGNPWYKTLPGVSVYREGLKLDDILNNTFTHEELEEAFSRLMSKAAKGVIDSHYTQLVEGFDVDENDKSLEDFLRRAIVGKEDPVAQ